MNNEVKKELRMKSLEFVEELRTIIMPRSQSDRTTFRRLAEYLVEGIESGKFNERVFGLVLEFAKEAAGPRSRNPAAVFVSILKEEIGYGRQN